MPQIIMAIAAPPKKCTVVPLPVFRSTNRSFASQAYRLPSRSPCGPSFSYHEKAASAPIHLYTYKQDNYSPSAGILQIFPVLFYNADIFSYFYKTMFLWEVLSEQQRRSMSPRLLKPLL